MIKKETYIRAQHIVGTWADISSSIKSKYIIHPCEISSSFRGSPPRQHHHHYQYHRRRSEQEQRHHDASGIFRPRTALCVNTQESHIVSHPRVRYIFRLPLPPCRSQGICTYTCIDLAAMTEVTAAGFVCGLMPMSYRYSPHLETACVIHRQRHRMLL